MKNIYLMTIFMGIATTSFSQFTFYGLGGKSIESIAFDNNGNIYATEAGIIYSSLDNGATWDSLDAFSTATIGRLFFTSTGEWVARVSSSAGSVTGTYVSSDQGQTWRKLSLGSREVTVNSQDIIFNLGSYKAYASSDLGVTQNEILSITNGDMNEISLGTQDELFVTMYNSTDSSGIWRSTDNGTSWTHVYNLDDDIWEVESHPNGMYYVNTSTSPKQILRSSDFGATWTIAGNTPSGIGPMVVLDDNNVLFGSYWAGVQKSFDQGATWAAYMGGITSGTPVYDLEKNAQGYVYVATDTGLYRSDSILVKETSVTPGIGTDEFREQSEIHVYPNPTSSTATVAVTGLGAEHLELFNLLGEKVQEISLKNGNGKIYAFNLPGGVYVLKSAGVNSSTQKLIIH